MAEFAEAGTTDIPTLMTHAFGSEDFYVLGVQIVGGNIATRSGELVEAITGQQRTHRAPADEDLRSEQHRDSSHLIAG